MAERFLIAALVAFVMAIGFGSMLLVTSASPLSSNTLAQTVYQPSLSQCLNFYAVGGCFGYVTEIVTTTFSDAGNGKVQGISSAPLLPNMNFIPFSEVPLTSNIGQYNLVNTPYLLTCPNAPNPSDPYEYLTSSNDIAGNRCIANLLPLITIIGYSSISKWTMLTVVSTSFSPSVKNPVSSYLGNLGFSNELNNSGNLFISANQNTNSYAFQEPPATNQSAVWDWYAKYANLASSSPVSLSYTGTANLLRPAAGLGFCIYSYSYTVASSATFRNAAIPVPVSLTSTGAPSQYQDVSLLPQIFYDANIPVLSSSLSSSSEYLTLNHSIYNPSNWVTPNTLEPFNLSTGTTLLANVSTYHSGSWFCLGFCSSTTYSLARLSANTLSFISPNTPVTYNKTFKMGLLASFESNTSNPGYNIQIIDPSFISVSPNNKIYVLNFTSHCGFAHACFFSHRQYSTILFNISAIPSGDYNLSPATAHPIGINSQSAFDNYWHAYWSNYLQLFTANFYITGICDLSSAVSPCYGSHIPVLGNAQIMQGTDPTGIATDYQGDVFITGTVSASGWTDISCWFGSIFSNGCPQTFQIAALYSNKQSKFATINIPINPRDIAASPNGKYIYISAPNSGNIVVIDGNTLQPAGNINLAYPSLDISQYLAKDGGPFNSSRIKSYYAGSSSVLDTAANHHPMAISEYDGLLYVVDNWTFSVNGGQSSILMLRAFSYNGAEVPIDSRTIPDIYGNTLTVNQFTTGAVSYNYPPYGWPLSANVSLAKPNSAPPPPPITPIIYQIPRSNASTYQGSFYSSISYCAYECTYSPSQMTSSNTFGYLPIGPFIKAIGNTNPTSAIENFGFTTDYNDTSYLIAHTGSNAYTLLVELRPNIQNYTRVSFAQNASYICMINTTAPQSTCLQNVQSLTALHPPLILVPSAFDFAENQGSPQRFLSIPNSFAASFPFGINSGAFQNSANSIKNNGISQTFNYNTITNGENQGSSVPVISNAITTYIRSQINGVFDFPYTVNIQKKTTFQQKSAQFYGSIGICLPLVPIWAQNSNGQQNYYLISKQHASSSTSNIPIEGGQSYLVFNTTKDTFQANMSDAGLIINPNIATILLTNRHIGEFYANISVEKAFNLPAPLTVNAIHFYSYNTQGFDQIDTFGIQPAFVEESLSSTGSNTLGVACSFCFLPNYYYSAPKSGLFTGNAILTSTSGLNTQNMTVFQLFKKLSYFNSEDLNLLNNSHILGYDRLVFTYADAFNNIVAVPMDADLANITTIAMNVTPVVSAANPNETTVQISGSAGYHSGLLNSYYPVPASSQIYLYYGENINYFNTSNTPTSNPAGYFKHAEQCTFSASQSSSVCQYANPLASATQGAGGSTAYLEEAAYQEYSPSFDSTGNCRKLSTSLLTMPPTPNCNIYGNFGLPATGYSLNGKPQICEATSSSGNGLLTSQIGLIGIAKANAQGQFSYSFQACGVGPQKIMAVWYGYPPPEPIRVTEPPLSSSVNFAGTTQNSVTTNQYNYYYAPNSTVSSVYIGSYLLSYGNISIILIGAIGAIIAVLFILGNKAYLRKPG